MRISSEVRGLIAIALKTNRRANDPAFAPFYAAVARFASFLNQPGDSYSDVRQLLNASWAFPSSGLPWRIEPAVLQYFVATYGIELPFKADAISQSVLAKAHAAVETLMRREGALQRTRFSAMDEAVSNLFVEGYETSVNYEAYFKMCKPVSCAIQVRQSWIATLATVIGIGKFSTPHFFSVTV